MRTVRKLSNYTELQSGVVVKSAETIETETRLLVSRYLCLVVENERGEEIRIMCPVAEMIEARPYVKTMIELCDTGSEFFNIHEIAERQRGGPLLYEEREYGADDPASSYAPDNLASPEPAGSGDIDRMDTV